MKIPKTFAPSQIRLATRLAGIGVIFLGALLFSGCATYLDKTERVTSAWNKGDYAAAANFAKRLANDTDVEDRLLAQLEWGATERGTGNFQQSLIAFEKADEMLSYWDSRPDVLLSSEVIAALNNMASLPYRGTGYDRIMLSTYQALNHLALGKNDAARVALNQALSRQQEAVENNAKRIEKAQQEAANTREKYDTARAQQDKKFASDEQRIYAESRNFSGYADYVNPFTTWLHGVYFLTNANDTGDFERARKSFERAVSFAPNCDAVQTDFANATALANNATAPENFQNITYVIFETGIAPSRREERLDIPLFIVSGTVPYAGAAVPKLVFHPNHNSTLVVSTAQNGTFRTQTLASMDGIVASDFNNALPEILTRTFVNTAIKATVSYAANSTARTYAQKSNSNAGALIYIASYLTTGILNRATTRADLRTWQTLPKEFQVARIMTPPDRKVRLLAGQIPAIDVEIIPASIGVIYVKNTGANTPLTVSQFALKN